jgi:hypothetical protein
LQFQSLRRLDITPTEVVDLGVSCARKDNGKDNGQGILKAFRPAASFRKVDGSRMDMECVFGGGMPGALRATDSKNTIMQLLAEKKPKVSPQILWEKRTNRWYLIVKRVVTRPPDDRLRGTHSGSIVAPRGSDSTRRRRNRAASDNIAKSVLHIHLTCTT